MELHLKNLIRVCPDPCCDAVFVNAPAAQTYCPYCGANTCKINLKQFINNYRKEKYFSVFDFETLNLYLPIL